MGLLIGDHITPALDEMPIWDGSKFVLTPHGSAEDAHPAQLLAYLMRAANVACIPTNAGWSSTLVGTGGVQYWPSFMYLFSGVNANSSSLQTARLLGFCQGAVTTLGITWDQKLLFVFEISRENTDAESTIRFQIKAANALGQLADKGIGLQVDNMALHGESYGVARGDVDLGEVLVSDRSRQVAIFHDPDTPKIDFYVDGVLEGTQSTANNMPTGTSNTVFIVISVSNGVTGTVNNIVYGMFPKVWQGR
ncbi:hypothetical protein LCGC14_1379650 [marine sediment metagenome]|uniref:Uncharacterized protein n=1 Tax=marine sediment metagenome TaxID=412755 RepID=A0A0F9K356_9ZZZZ